MNYALVHSTGLESAPNESTIRFRPDGEMLMVVRREQGNRKGLLGRSNHFLVEPADTGVEDQHTVVGKVVDGQQRVPGRPSHRAVHAVQAGRCCPRADRPRREFAARSARVQPGLVPVATLRSCSPPSSQR